MRLRFTKMHGLGNDFVMIDGINQKFKPTPKRIKMLSDRNLGIGCDQVLLVEPPEDPNQDFKYRIFNHDGSEVENCGNGARCFAKFVRDRKLTGLNQIKVETKGGNLLLDAHEDGNVTVDMGAPSLEPAKIPFNAPARQDSYKIQSSVGEITLSAVSMGNPHAVIVVEDTKTAPVNTLGAELEQHPDFPERVNVGFMQILSRDEINLRVFERGVGETKACGSGACAAVVAGNILGELDDKVQVNVQEGALHIKWAGENHPVLMSGPAATVYHGQINLN